MVIRKHAYQWMVLGRWYVNNCWFGHNWSRWSKVEHGRQIRTCFNCGKVEYNLISSIEWQNWAYRNTNRPRLDPTGVD